ncbi:mandelate racemase/muconate lactonizing enzyme family protein [Arachidicoccus rhizosphaerae]|nr:dipeptide epimerase [Arachidicoccus rhizosphaerae]
MKITHTEIYGFSISMVPFAIATGTMDYAQNVLIRIYTDEGLIGTGECSAFPMIVGETQGTCLAVGRDLAAIIKDKDPLQIQQHLEDFDRYIAGNTTIKSAFDMALVDIAAQADNKPLFAYLGGQLKPITTDITVGIGTAEQMASQALTFKENKAQIIKVKVGKDPKEDIRRIELIRAAIGPDIQIQLDANQGWSLQAAKTALGGMQALGLDIAFCEQPLPSYLDHEILALKAEVGIPIMADESCYHLRDVEKCHRAGFDYINIKLAKSGGITRGLEIASAAAAYAIPCMMGGMLESRVALTAMTHMVMASGNIRFFDMDTCLLGHLEDPVTRGVHIQDYRLSLPEPLLPGIGIQTDAAFLEKCDRWVV